MGIWVENPKEGSAGNISWGLVQSRFDLSQKYAESSYAMTTGYVTSLATWLGSLDDDLPDTREITVQGVSIPSLSFTGRPSFGNVALPTDWPTTLPNNIVFEAMPTFDTITLPTMTFHPPAWTTPIKPTIVNHASPGDGPTIREISPPAAPSITLPSPPSLREVVLPSPPSITIAPLDARLPEEILRTPAEFSWNASPYNSPIWIDLLNKVVDGIRNGGTGLDSLVYQDMWDRALIRHQKEADRRYQETEDFFAAKGFELPSGAMAASLREVAADIGDKLTEINGKMHETEATLAQTNTHYMLTTGKDLETILREFHNACDNRTLEAAKAVATSSIEIFNALVSRYNAYLERFKAEASVYESRIKASLTEVEIFKAQVEAAQVSSDVQKNLVAIYTEQIRALETQVKIYTAQVEGTQAQAELEKLKLEVFRTRIEAYVANMGAERVKVELYTAEVGAERVKAETYAEQVRSYVAEVEGRKAQADLNIKILTAALEKNRMLVEKYQGEMSGYTAKVDAVSRKTQSMVEGFKAEVAAYSAETEAKGMEYGARTKEMEARIQEAKFNLERAVAEVDAATKGFLAVKELQLKGTEASINVGSQLAASAWSAVNASASLGTTASESEQYSYSHGGSITESHHYEHE